MQGATGPNRGYAGFGSTIAALAGLTEPSGLPGRAPVGTGTHYPDHVPNPGHALVALLAALVHRNRTGQGGRIELSQFESIAGLTGPAMIRYSVTGELPRRQGNRAPWAAPHGVYPCRGADTWIAISARTDDERAAVADVLDVAIHPDDGDELETMIAASTRNWDRWELAKALQASGVPASAVETAGDVFDDPDLTARGYWRTLEHPVMGPVRFASAPHLWDGQPVSPRTPAPLLGEHTEQIATGLLGLSEREYRQLVTDQVLW
jgi:benzylsuccinate CoA-transferase BbsF subunit